MLGELGFAGSDHLFPVGMRVLVVDHDHTCLELLDNLLRKCFYQVTTSSESMKALEMMRKNRNMFDLIISEVNMPHMDGFKLLQQVRLEEMDLPLIMLSEKGDKEQVMKGVMHGACDYLIKPVRIQELQNIWQHVVRKKINFKDQNKKLQGQKRKEQSFQEEEEEDGEENGQEERSFGKKPRVKWNALLHRKFVAAVNQLGLHKASPKKILALMNVEGLTRENVASHLQKYRLSLKKPTKQDSMVAALCNSNTNTNSDPYLQMGDFCTSSGSTRILSSTLPSSAGLNLRGIISSSAQKAPINESSNLLEDILTSIEINQFQNNNICDVVPVPLDEDARGELQCQEGLLGNNNIKANSCYYTQQHQNLSSAFNTLCSTLFSPHSTPSIPPQLDEVENFYSDTRMMTNDAFFMQQMDSLQGLIEDNSFVSLDWMT